MVRNLAARLIVVLVLLSRSNSLWAQQPTTAPAATQAAADAQLPDDAAVEAKLNEHLPEVRYKAVPLSQVFEDLGSKSGVKIVVDWDALKQAEVAKDSPVTARLRNIKLSKAIELVFLSVEGEDDAHKLTRYTSEGAIRITTRSEAAKRLVTRSYDIADLLAGYSEKLPAGTPGGMNGISSDRTDRQSQILEYITNNVDTDTWKDHGGNDGEIKFDAQKHALIIQQSPETHRKIAAVLAALRDASSTKALRSTTQP